MLAETSLSWTEEQEDIIQQLFELFLRHVDLPLDEFFVKLPTQQERIPSSTLRNLMMVESQGSVTIPSCRSLGMDIVWAQANLVWLWQYETRGCCLTFLAEKGCSEFNSETLFEVHCFEWTIEVSINSSMLSTWKAAHLTTACMTFDDCALVGEFVSQQLQPRPIFCCDDVHLSRLTANVKDQISTLISKFRLDQSHLPYLQWNIQPMPCLAFRTARTLTVGEALRIVYEELARNESFHVGKKVQGESEIYSFVQHAVGLSSKLAAKGLSYVAPTLGVAVSMAASGVNGGIMWTASAPKTLKTLARVKKSSHEEFNNSVGEAALLYDLASPVGLCFGSQQEEKEIIFGEEIPSLVEVEASNNVNRILRGEKKRSTMEQKLCVHSILIS
jgi:hypothetical protein